MDGSRLNTVFHVNTWQVYIPLYCKYKCNQKNSLHFAAIAVTKAELHNINHFGRCL